MAADASAAALMPRTIAEKEREENMLFVQLEALAKDRRDHLSTRDFKERRAEFVPSRNIVRRVDQAGTEENRTIQGEARKHLTAWNSVYKDLQDDGTADLDLGDVNEGLGQTHRGKLQADESLRHYAPEQDHFFRGGHRGGHGVQAGSGSGGRGGRFPGHSTGRMDRAAAVKRSRVVKGSKSPGTPPEKPIKQSKETSGPRAASSLSSLRHPTKAGNVFGGRERSSKILQSQPASTPKDLKEVTLKEPSRPRVPYSGQLATPSDFMASAIRKRSKLVEGSPSALQKNGNNTQATSAAREIYSKRNTNAKAQQVSIQPTAQAKLESKTEKPKGATQEPHRVAPVFDSTNALNSRKTPIQPDLLDSDFGQEVTHQPVIGFTHSLDSSVKADKAAQNAPIPAGSSSSQVTTSDDTTYLIQKLEGLRAKGALTTDDLLLLQKLVDLLDTRADFEHSGPKIPIEPAKSLTYSTADILALRPKTALQSPKVIDSPVNPRQAQAFSLPSPSTVVAPSDLDPIQELNERLAAERELIMGEHVHRTRFQRAESVDKSIHSDQTESIPPKSPASHGRPILPTHLTDRAPITDHGVAARKQYSSSGGSTSKASRLGPTLPAHVANMPPVTDMGAAVRAEYESAPIFTRGRGMLSSHNGRLRSASKEIAEPTPSTSPKPRSSMLNRTGFIGQAENWAVLK